MHFQETRLEITDQNIKDEYQQSINVNNSISLQCLFFSIRAFFLAKALSSCSCFSSAALFKALAFVTADLTSWRVVYILS